MLPYICVHIVRQKLFARAVCIWHLERQSIYSNQAYPDYMLSVLFFSHPSICIHVSNGAICWHMTVVTLTLKMYTKEKIIIYFYVDVIEIQVNFLTNINLYVFISWKKKRKRMWKQFLRSGNMSASMDTLCKVKTWLRPSQCLYSQLSICDCHG